MAEEKPSGVEPQSNPTQGEPSQLPQGTAEPAAAAPKPPPLQLVQEGQPTPGHNITIPSLAKVQEFEHKDTAAKQPEGEPAKEK